LLPPVIVSEAIQQCCLAMTANQLRSDRMCIEVTGKWRP